MSRLADATPSPLWWEGLDLTSRAPLRNDRDVDVLIIGAGYTGLWTAYYLAEADPSLSIVVVDANHVGFGASGRNGGWCYDGFAADLSRIEKMSDDTTARRFGAALRETVDIVGAAVTAEGIDCAFHKGGTLEYLRNGGQVARGRKHVEEAHHYGWSASETRVLSAEEAAAHGRVAGSLGALWSEHTAAVQPARLAHGLAEAVERRRVSIYEATPVVEIGPRTARTDHATIRARSIVRATEAYTNSLPGHSRDLAPIYSMMIATEPLGDRWEELGFGNRPTFGDLRHMIIYGQRTADGRIAFGGRGAPYEFRSRIRDTAEFPPDVFEGVLASLLELFPSLADVAVTHRWSGVLGISRNWLPTLGYDPQSGQGWAGGYVGSGVAATNLAGRTLADLIIGRQTDLTRFPWVNHRVRRWEPEPLRWAGITTARGLMKTADAEEARTNRPSAIASTIWRIAESRK